MSSAVNGCLIASAFVCDAMPWLSIVVIIDGTCAEKENFLGRSHDYKLAVNVSFCWAFFDFLRFLYAYVC